MNFDFSKSKTSDLQNKISINKLDIMAGNILYLTHELDKLNKNVLFILNNSKLQKQVDEYFDEDSEHIPEEKIE